MKARQYYESDYLTADDFERGPAELVIAAVCENAFKQRDGSDQSKLVVHFKNSAKGLVLNKANAVKVIDKLGDETDDWTGATLTLVRGTTSFGGRTVPSIMVAGVRKPPTKKD